MNGLVQALNDPLSMRHWKVAPASDENVNETVGPLVLLLAGPPVIVVSGGVASTVQVRVAGLASTFQAASRARTWKV